jgi:hypothetical protein
VSTAVTIQNIEGLDQLRAEVMEYQRVSGRTARQVLVQKAAQLLYGNTNPKFGATFAGLAQLFSAEAPADGEIWAAARARHFRVGRKILGPGRLSPTAIARAREMMEGYKTIRISTRADGSALKFVRAGERKKRVHYRYGRNSYAVSGRGNSQTFAGLKRGEDEKAVNFRAVATFFELQVRTQGRRFLGSAWLLRRWRKLAQSDIRREDQGIWMELKNNNPRSRIGLLGEVAARGGEDTPDAQVRISSFVPGTLAVGRGRAIFSKAIAGVRADIGAYLARKTAEANRQALRDTVRLLK